MCEMLIAAYEATNNRTYLARAEALAHTFAVVLAAKAGGFVWEHYDEHWNINWNYNITSTNRTRHNPIFKKYKTFLTLKIHYQPHSQHISSPLSEG
jgi:mannose/cellobiose epimerase-like protein (N-acyl-D-glucosamine 2-epimerase family)